MSHVKINVNKKHSNEFWDSLEMDSNDDLSNCYLFGNLVLVETENREPRTCYLKKDVPYGGISKDEHDLFVDYFGADYTDTYGEKYNSLAQVSDTYWLRAGKHTKLK